MRNKEIYKTQKYNIWMHYNDGKFEVKKHMYIIYVLNI